MSGMRPSRAVALFGLVVGAAGWASRAELDEVVVDGVRQRIALVPSWQPFVAFAALALFVTAGAAYLLRRSRLSTARARFADVLLPGLALGLLVVPYLPVLPDWWPWLQALAGEGIWMIWAIVGSLFVWGVWPLVPRLPAWWARRSLGFQTLTVWIVAATIIGASAARLTHTVLFPSGDEPHYLVIAQSLLKDGDLKIENNHQRRDYAEYFARDLDPHYLTRGSDGEIYSVHPVGMPVLIAPAFALGGYDLVVWAFVAMAAAAAAAAWRWVAVTTAAPGHATLAWAAVAFSAPFLVNAFTIYPEIPAALAVTLAATLALRPAPDARPWHDVALGLLAGALPWLSTKYAPMSAALVAVTLGRRWWPMHAGERRAGAAGATLRVLAPYGAALAAWFAFFYAYWGTPWPSAPYGALTQTELDNTFFGVPGLLFDQEYGLLVYAPAYLLAFAGFGTMIRRPGPLRRLGLEVLVVFGALLFTVGAFRIWWGGSAAPGRPLTSGLPLLMLPVAIQIGAAGTSATRRAAQHVLIWTGATLAAVLVLAQNGLLLANDRDGTSALLAWLSARWPLWTVAPTFIAHEAPRELVDVAMWALAAVAGSWALRRARVTNRGAAALAALGLVLATVVVGAAIVRALPPADPPLPGIDLRARARLPALDSFDRVTRPLAIRYAPFHVSRAAEVESLLALGVTPGLRTDPQPVRVLHNGRFSLPAGRYRVDVRWASRRPLPARAGSTLALQVGRIGPPLTTWTVDPAPDGTWSAEFWLPLDAAFVGLRGDGAVERSVAAVTFSPLDVVDAGSRTVTPPVLAAARYGEVLVLFHDELTYPEPTGFWTTGQRASRLSIACPGGCTDGVALRVHSGRRPNQLHLQAFGWTRDVPLVPETQVTVTVPPPPAGGVVELDTNTTTGFVPVDIDPALHDRRFLGAWIEVSLPAKETP
ncbi:MAG: hypothetical protein R2745_02905 [Vicinamibacterales bacterium]